MAIDKTELERYRAEQELYERAINGDVDACILWLTTRCPDKWSNDPPAETKDDGD